jgi:hypothetical protein
MAAASSMQRGVSADFLLADVAADFSEGEALYTNICALSIIGRIIYLAPSRNET